MSDRPFPHGGTRDTSGVEPTGGKTGAQKSISWKGLNNTPRLTWLFSSKMSKLSEMFGNWDALKWECSRGQVQKLYRSSSTTMSSPTVRQINIISRTRFRSHDESNFNKISPASPSLRRCDRILTSWRSVVRLTSLIDFIQSLAFVASCQSSFILSYLLSRVIACVYRFQRNVKQFVHSLKVNR